MLRKVSVFILLSAFLSVAAFAQDEPPKPDEPNRLGRVFSMAFGGGSYLGIEIRDVNKSNYAELGLSEVRGVNVTKVVENSPADKAGLKTGDVIVAFDGQSVTSTRKLTRMISEVAPDHTVDLTVVRGGSEMRIPVTVGKREMPGFSNGTFVFPSPPAAPGAPNAPEAPRAFKYSIPDIDVGPLEGLGENFVWAFGRGRTIGIGVSSLSKQLGDYFGVEEGKGLLVTSVEPDSPASRAGLRAGDVIVEADGNEVKGMRDLTKALNSKEEGDVTLTIIRDKNRRTISVTPEKGKGGSFYFDGDSLEMLKNAPNSRIRVAPRTGVRAMPAIVTRGSRVIE
ncbi:MAG TPA: PDZ domain-containing protein [Aridibacter sp.]|nr:PDZ domain-containing protein [Aridibacter sp.]